MDKHFIESIRRFLMGLAIIFVCSAIIFLPILFWWNHFQLEANLDRIEVNLVSGFQQRSVSLKNATWALQRYVYLKNRSNKEDQKLISSVKSTFLPGFSYGIESDYFMLLNTNERVVMEIRRGALTERKSNVSFLGWHDVITSGEKLYYRPCRVNAKTYLCLLNAPNFREFLNEDEKYLALITIDEQELYSLGRVFEQQKLSLLPATSVQFQFPYGGDPTLPTPKSSVLSGNRLLDSGFWVSGSTNIRAFLNRSLFLIFGFAVLLNSLLWALNLRFRNRLKSQTELAVLKAEKENLEVVRTLIRGVLHDIQSPFTALKILASQETDPNKRPMLDLLIKRMGTITSDLEGKSNFGGKNLPSLLPVDLLVQLMVKEKSQEWGNRVDFVVDRLSPDLWILGQFSEFLRMMSNLMNNAAQASLHGGHIWLSVYNHDEKFLKVEVRDEGCGIQKLILDRLTTVGGSYNKIGGSGFGLYHARQTVDSIGGSIEIRSEEGKGTIISLRLARKPSPKWRHTDMDLNHYQKFVVIEDEDIFADIWKRKLAITGKQVLLFKHPSLVPPELLAQEDVFFIVDNNFDGQANIGIKFIQKIGPSRSALATSDWWVSQVQEEVNKIQTHLIGKDVLEWTSVKAL